MSKKAIFYMMIILIMGVMLFGMSTKTYATNLESLFENDKSGYEDIKGNTNTNTNSGTNTNTNTNTNTSTGSDKKEEYNKAGLVEDSIMIIGMIVLGITSIYAYKKVNEYEHI